MDMPNIGYIVWYVLPARDLRPAIVVKVYSENEADLIMFGRPADGDEFATGTAPRSMCPGLKDIR